MPPVNGVCGAASGGASGLPSPFPYGVWGDCRNHLGIYGSSLNYIGIWGESRRQLGVYGASEQRAGVYGYSPEADGVIGVGRLFGVIGVSDARGSDLEPFSYSGIYGQGDYGSYSEGRVIGTYAAGPAGGFAGYFNGHVYVSGRLYTSPPKSSVVSHPDGTQRVLSAVESPESWFEDFGRAELREGHAVVELDEDFAALLHTDDYHVFLTPEGDSNGLYVSGRTDREFEVREQQKGRSSLTFSYRVVARPKEVEPKRLQVFEPPPERTPVEFKPDELKPPTDWKDEEPAK
jgi:hypothetical protein